MICLWWVGVWLNLRSVVRGRSPPLTSLSVDFYRVSKNKPHNSRIDGPFTKL